MKLRICRLLASAALMAGLAVPQAASALSVYDVIMMSRNGYEAGTIIRLINDTGSAFALEAMDAVRLKDAGVSDEVVAAMFAAVPAAAGDANTEGGTAMDTPTPATLSDLLLLAEGRISENVIIAFLDSRGISFKPDTAAVKRLRDAGLGENALNHLVTRTAVWPVPDPQYTAPAEPPVPASPPVAYTPPSQGTGITSYREEPAYPLYEERVTYIYPPAYYGPSYFIGFSGLHHSMFRHRYTHAHPYPGHWFFDRRHVVHHHKDRDTKHGHHDKDRDHRHHRDDERWSRISNDHTDRGHRGDRNDWDRNRSPGSSSSGSSGSSGSNSGITRGWNGREDGRKGGQDRPTGTANPWNDLHKTPYNGMGAWGVETSRAGTSRSGSLRTGSTVQGGTARSGSLNRSTSTIGAGTTPWNTKTGTYAPGVTASERSATGASSSRDTSTRSSTGSKSSSRTTPGKSSTTENTSASTSARPADSGVTRGWNSGAGGGSTLRPSRR
jgi:hypothetical protein